ncbi:MAG: hypothetical protein WCH99_10005 [Verrucomicrobiota bacterium]
MNQHTNNKHSHHSKAGATKALNYCKSKELHPDHDLTLQQSWGLTSVANLVEHEAQLLEAYRFENRFSPGKNPTRLNDWPIITEPRGVRLTPEQQNSVGRKFYPDLGPGVIGVYNVHIKQKPDENGKVVGPDSNFFVSAYRIIGPFVLPRRDPDISEYRLIKNKQDAHRLKDQHFKKIPLPDVDAQRRQHRKVAGKLYLFEQLAAQEWHSNWKNNPHNPVEFGAQSSLQSCQSTIESFKKLGFEIKMVSLPKVDQGSDRLDHTLCWLFHPKWQKDRQAKAKYTVGPNARRPQILVNLIRINIEARQLVRTWRLVLILAPMLCAIRPKIF